MQSLYEKIEDTALKQSAISLKEFISNDKEIYPLLSTTESIDKAIVSATIKIYKLVNNFIDSYGREASRVLQEIGLEVVELMRNCPTLYFKNPIDTSEKIIKIILNQKTLGSSPSPLLKVRERVTDYINIERHRVTSLIEKDVYGLYDIFQNLQEYLSSSEVDGKIPNSAKLDASDKINWLIDYFNDPDLHDSEFIFENDYFSKITKSIKVIEEIGEIIENSINDDSYGKKFKIFYTALFQRVSTIFSEEKSKIKAKQTLYSAWSDLGSYINPLEQERNSIRNKISEFKELISKSKLEAAEAVASSFEPKSSRRF